MSDKVEIADFVDVEVENPVDLIPQEDPLGADAMDSMIAAGKKIEAYDKALTAIMNVVMKRTYAGDWVSHARAKDPVHLRSASLSGSGCERVAVILGINEKNWKEREKQFTEDSKHYTFRYEADFTLGGRMVHAYGEASTMNKFFSFADGQYKELKDIREDHIRKAAYRECFKDGIRRLLGLRKIPLMKLMELGFNIDLVHYVNFKDSKEATNAASTAKPEGTEAPITDAEQVIITIESMAAKMSKGGKPFYNVTDSEGVKWYAWGNKNSEKIIKLQSAFNQKVPITVMVKMGEYPTIEAILS